jgi:septal ring factor EnvC (AmiA/AmiB activator)
MPDDSLELQTLKGQLAATQGELLTCQKQLVEMARERTKFAQELDTTKRWLEESRSAHITDLQQMRDWLASRKPRILHTA